MKIPEEKRGIIEIEYQEIIKESNRKEDARIKELKEAGKWTGGLDGENGAFDDIMVWTRNKIIELAEKYGIMKD